MQHRFSCALITGASSGLGAEFARELAPLCDELVLLARRSDRLESLASELRSAIPKLSLSIASVDLSSPQDRQAFLSFLQSEGICPDLLVNNAGLGDYGEFDSADWEKIASMIRVNIEALTHLTHALLPEIRLRQGAILNVSSLASVLPIPDFAVYAATKAYVSSFSEAVRLEVREDRVAVLAVCPGPVSTEFGQVARREGFKKDFFPGRGAFYTSSRTVVRQAVRSLLRDRARLFPGWKAKLSALLLCPVPLFVLRRIMALRPRRVVNQGEE